MSLIDLTQRHYRDLEPTETDAEHPVDQLLWSIPEVMRVDRAAQRLSDHLTDPKRRIDTEVWSQYEDLRFEQRIVWLERSFDIGYEYGRIAGLAASLADAHRPAVEAVSRALQNVAIASPVEREMTLAALLAVARAIVLTALKAPANPTA